MSKTTKVIQHFIPIKQTTSQTQTAQRVEPPSDVAAFPEQHIWPAYEYSPDGVRAGIWESAAGSWDVNITGYTEFCVLKEGEAEVTENDGTRHLLVAGDGLVMQDGFQGVWTVSKYVRKYYFIAATAEK